MGKCTKRSCGASFAVFLRLSPCRTAGRRVSTCGLLVIEAGIEDGRGDAYRHHGTGIPGGETKASRWRGGALSSERCTNEPWDLHVSGGRGPSRRLERCTSLMGDAHLEPWRGAPLSWETLIKRSGEMGLSHERAAPRTVDRCTSPAETTISTGGEVQLSHGRRSSRRVERCTSPIVEAWLDGLRASPLPIERRPPPPSTFIQNGGEIPVSPCRGEARTVERCSSLVVEPHPDGRRDAPLPSSGRNLVDRGPLVGNC
jgi:hypothetical protein